MPAALDDNLARSVVIPIAVKYSSVKINSIGKTGHCYHGMLRMILKFPAPGLASLVSVMAVAKPLRDV